MSSPTSSGWWYASNGDRKGPVSEQELQRLLISGTLGPNSLVWKQGMEAWIPAAQIEALKSLLASLPLQLPPAIPARTVKTPENSDQQLTSSWKQVFIVVTFTAMVVATPLVIRMFGDLQPDPWEDLRRQRIEQRVKLREECHSTEEYKNYQHQLKLKKEEEGRIYAEKVREAKRRYCEKIKGLTKYQNRPPFCFPRRDPVDPSVGNPCRDLELVSGRRRFEFDDRCNYHVECPLREPK